MTLRVRVDAITHNDDARPVYAPMYGPALALAHERADERKRELALLRRWWKTGRR